MRGAVRKRGHIQNMSPVLQEVGNVSLTHFHIFTMLPVILAPPASTSCSALPERGNGSMLSMLSFLSFPCSLSCFLCINIPLSIVCQSQGDKAGDTDTGARRSQRGGPCLAAAAKEAQHELQHEFESMQAFCHPNIVQALGTVVVSDVAPTLAGIILPFFPHGSLRTLMHSRCGAHTRWHQPVRLPLWQPADIDAHQLRYPYPLASTPPSTLMAACEH